MKVLFLTHAFPRFDGDVAGGFLLRLASALGKQGVDVKVVAPASAGAADNAKLNGTGIARFHYAPRKYETLAYGGNMAEQVRDSWSARFTLLGREGLPTIAMSGLDVALWDALARATSLPLARLLGGELRPVPAYNSNALGLDPPEKVAEEAQELLAEGFRAVKLRLGRKTLWEDVVATRAVRAKIPDEALLMTDFNQALTVAEALARGRALDRERVYWIEEPVRHDDYAGAARIAREVETPIQIGENFLGTRAMAAAIAAGAADYVMPDLGRIGGVTGWLRAAALADAAGLEMSSHLHPEVSAQLLAVTPSAHFLEYVDWAVPILARPLEIADGQALPAEAPGAGLDWNEEAVARFALD